MRMISGTILALAVAGCGGSNSAAPEPKTPLPADPSPQPPAPANTTPQPAPTDPKKDANPSPPAAPPAAWELDPAKHAIPDKPVTGQFGGKSFTPTVEVQGDTLTFRAADKDGQGDREIVIKFSPDQAKKAADGLKLVVKPDQASGSEVPEVETDLPDRKPISRVVFPAGYALTLELGKRAAGKVPGKVYLSLPVIKEGNEKAFLAVLGGAATVSAKGVIKEGDERAFLAGTFSADWVRPFGQPPTADEAPFVQGAITAPAGVEVRVGYVGITAGKLLHDMLSLTFPEAGAATRSDHNKPRVSLLVASNKTAGRYDHTHLEPGRYLVYAGTTGGPLAWTWVTVEPSTQATHNFAIDPSKAGNLEVTVPAGTSGPVTLAPADDGKSWEANLPVVAAVLGLQADAKDNKATFTKLGPGRYEVRAGDLTGTAEVKPGETAKVELKKK